MVKEQISYTRKSRNVQLLINIFEGMSDRKEQKSERQMTSSIELMNGHVAATVAKFEKNTLESPEAQESDGTPSKKCSLVDLKPKKLSVEKFQMLDEEKVEIEIVELGEKKKGNGMKMKSEVDLRLKKEDMKLEQKVEGNKEKLDDLKGSAASIATLNPRQEFKDHSSLTGCLPNKPEQKMHRRTLSSVW